MPATKPVDHLARSPALAVVFILVSAMEKCLLLYSAQTYLNSIHEINQQIRYIKAKYSPMQHSLFTLLFQKSFHVADEQEMLNCRD